MSDLTTLTALIARKQELEREVTQAHSKYTQIVTAAKEEAVNIERRILWHKTGLDLAKMDRARTVIELKGDPTHVVNSSYSAGSGVGVRLRAVEDAKALIISGGARLFENFVGVKNYDGCGDQREDHPYGYGPRHGHIVFSVGLTAERRKIKKSLTAEEIEDSLYLLTVWPDMAAKAAA